MVSRRCSEHANARRALDEREARPVSRRCAATVLGLLAALAVMRHSFPGRRAFLALMTLPMVAPGIVLGVSLLLFARYVGFKTGFTSLFLGHTLLALPYCTFIIMASLARFDRTLEDAARGLGASETTVLWRVTLPEHHAGHHRRAAVRLHDLDRRVRRQLLSHLGRNHDPADPHLLDREGRHHAGDQCRVDADPGGNSHADPGCDPADLVRRRNRATQGGNP